MKSRFVHFFSFLTVCLALTCMVLCTTSCNRSSSRTIVAEFAVTQDLTAGAISSTQVSITWLADDVDGEQVEIERGTDQLIWELVSVSETVAGIYMDSVPATGDLTYYYRLRGRNNNDQGQAVQYSNYSNSAIAIIMTPPTDLVADAVSGTQIDLQWSDNSNLEDGYAIWRMGVGEAYVQIGQVEANEITFTDDTVEVGTRYFYKVQAFNEGGHASSFSPEFEEVTPIDPWGKGYGGDQNDNASRIIALGDEEFVIAGNTYSYGAGEADMWVLKVNLVGDLLWQWAYGGDLFDSANVIISTSDGGFLLAGETRSTGAMGQDAWVLKLNAAQDIEWYKVIDASDNISNDYVDVLLATSDGGYLVGGSTELDVYHSDAWVAKLDLSGNLLWSRVIQGTKSDYLRGAVELMGAGYIVCGGTQSFGSGETDAWMALLLYDGSAPIATNPPNSTTVLTYGGEFHDHVKSFIRTADRGLLFAGQTKSFYPGGQAGEGDGWIMKLQSLEHQPWSPFPEWEIRVGGPNEDTVNSAVPTNDGGYICVGMIGYKDLQPDSGDAWIFKLDADGAMEWHFAYGGNKFDHATDVVQLIDDGYLVTGEYMASSGSRDIWILKISEEGEIQFSSASGLTRSPSEATAPSSTTVVPWLPEAYFKTSTPSMSGSVIITKTLTDCVPESLTE